jgi:hypothetical protein
MNSGKVFQVNAIAIDRSNPATVYAGSRNNGLFKSVNGGQSWSRILGGANDRANPVVACLAIDPRDSALIYAGTPSNSVVKIRTR